ncbi:MAG: MgtC/SapB family protein [Bacteroidota bacterium]
MTGLAPFDLVARLALAAAFGGFIGLEREIHGRPAGLRTHLLVALGSCLAMLLSVHGFGTGWNRDPARLAAQVLSGIGFLGAGTILREGVTVKGLTTAASLWLVAGIGLAIGLGSFLAAIVATVFAVAALFFLEKLEKRFISPWAHNLEVSIADRPGKLGEVCSTIGRHGMNIRQIDLDREDEDTVALTITVEGRSGKEPDKLLEDLRTVEGIHRLRWR